MILEMSRITKQFGSTQVLTEVDFACVEARSMP